MSTEVERSQLGSGLTAEEQQQKNQNKSDGPREPEEKPQRGSDRQDDHHHHHHRRGSEEAKSPADTHKSRKENDKENDQSGNAADASPAAEVAKRQVVEAPPPKVNPWTKRTTGRVPGGGIGSPAPQEKGERWFFLNVITINGSSSSTAGCGASTLRFVEASPRVNPPFNLLSFLILVPIYFFGCC